MKSTNLSKSLIIAILLIFSQSAIAQYKSVSLGIKVAPNLGWIKSDQDGYQSQGTVAGFAWGMAAEFYFAENYAFATGFSFDFQNGKLSYPEQRNVVIGDLTRNYRLKYLEIPAMIKMKTNEISGFKFFGQIGLGAGIRLNSKAKDAFKSAGQTIAATDFKSIDSQTRLFKASMIVGAGAEYPFDESTALVVGINFNNGITNALKGNNSVNSSLSHKGVPNFIELSIAVMF